MTQDELLSADLIAEEYEHLHLQKDDLHMKVFQDIPDNVKEMSNFEARNYVIGFIGKKLGLRPRSSQKSESWISLKGKGRLFEPSDELINICEICDRKFDEFHKDGLKDP